MWATGLFAAYLFGTTPLDLGWPTTTRSATTRVAAKVRATPHGARIGELPRGERIGWLAIVRTDDRCGAWLAIAPRGWVCAADLAPSDDAPALTHTPRKLHDAASAWRGLALDATTLPLAWASGNVVNRPGGKKVRRLAPRTVVSVLETRGRFVRIGDAEWVPRRHVHVAATSPRPADVGDDDRWIDVDLDQQVLVAYQGDTAVFATLVSTGRHGWTHVGRYRISRKVAVESMADRARHWNFHEVPFVSYYRKDYALHGAWWHDRFGETSSEGCVNLTPADAGWVFDFTSPALPEGWVEVRVAPEDGTVVRIRDRHHPDPPARYLPAY